MTFGSLALLWLLSGSQTTPTADLVTYSRAAIPFASTTLFVNGQSNAVTILSQTNAKVRIVPAQYQDLQISKAFYVVCILPRNYGLRRISVWADSPYHLIPADVVEYKTYDPSYVKLDIDMAYLENRSDELTLANHKIHIDFYTNP